MKSLLTTSNPKTLKGEARGYFTAILHLAPAEMGGGPTVCAAATAGCMASCLNTAGRGGIFKPGQATNAVLEARKRRTMWYRLDPAGFRARLESDIARHVEHARKLDLTPAVRINGTSDLPALADDMARSFPGVQFYDYTKLPLWRRECPPNLQRTFSRSESNAPAVGEALSRGWNVAVVFMVKRGAPLPVVWDRRKVVDGDVSDLRFLDPKGGVIVGLRAKGRAKKDTTGFVVREGA